MVTGSADAEGFEQLLIVLMLVEILHTVRISIRSHKLMIVEPFLIVGLIASIRADAGDHAGSGYAEQRQGLVSEGARVHLFTAR